MIRDGMGKIYSQTPPADIPGNIESQPKTLVELVDTESVKLHKVIGMGCGAGN